MHRLLSPPYSLMNMYVGRYKQSVDLVRVQSEPLPCSPLRSILVRLPLYVDNGGCCLNAHMFKMRKGFHNMRGLKRREIQIISFSKNRDISEPCRLQIKRSHNKQTQIIPVSADGRNHQTRWNANLASVPQFGLDSERRDDSLLSIKMSEEKLFRFQPFVRERKIQILKTRPSYNIRFFANSLKFENILITTRSSKIRPRPDFVSALGRVSPRAQNRHRHRHAGTDGGLTTHNGPDWNAPQQVQTLEWIPNRISSCVTQQRQLFWPSEHNPPPWSWRTILERLEGSWGTLVKRVLSSCYSSSCCFGARRRGGSRPSSRSCSKSDWTDAGLD